MAEFDYKEYARQMRKNCAKDYNGNIICSAELWEQIASIIESTANVVPKSEVERLEAEKDALIKNYAECMKDYAREIFEGIEDIIKNWEFDHCSKETGYFVRKSYNGTMIVKCLAELKKKYTKEGGE